MTYAQDRICWDADSHLMPLPDFLSRHADARWHDDLLIGGGANGGEAFEKWFGKMVSDVATRRADSDKTAELEENVIASAKGWYAHGACHAEERSRTLDLLGFRGQLVFSTFAGEHLRSPNPDLVYAGTRAHTRAMVDFCSGDPRLLPVAMIPLGDPERALAELDEALRLGIAAVQVPSDPPGGHQKGFSPAHVELDPFWARLAEARVPAILHIGGGRLLPRPYHENGRPRPKDWLGGGENLRAKDFPAVHQSPENFLNALVLDGVFDAHPALKCGVIELGATWVPGFVRNLDHAFDSFRRNEPRLQALSLKPSEFVRRQIKFTPFPFEDAGWLVEQGGEELFLFSSDYPHPEGGRDPIGRFERSFDAAETSPSARTRFYSRNFEDLFGLSARD
ncbi:MAG: amidohydrolase [Myxococcales bacterium]|nr:amidohydrolase [Myxococcales bacterium]